MGSLIETILSHAKPACDHNVISWVGQGGVVEERLSYQQIKSHVLAIGYDLQHRGGVKQHDRVVLLFPPGPDFILCFLACLYIGAIPVPLKMPSSSKRFGMLQAIIEDCKPHAVISPDETFLAAINAHRFLYERLSLLTTQILPSPIDIAFLQYTSGSTGLPKGVMVGAGNLMHNFEMMKKHIPLLPDDIAGTWLPHYHDMGLIGAYLGVLYFGGCGYYMSPFHFMQDPNSFLQLISDVGISITQCPNAALDWMVRHWDGRTLSLASLRCILDGAEPVYRPTLAKFYNTFKSVGLKKEALMPCYGLAEATLFVARATPEDWDEAHLPIHYEPCDEIEVQIVDVKTNHPCPSEKEGEIWIKSPSNALGYYGHDDSTKATFQAKLNGFDGGYLRTGDLGYLQNNKLVITGRLKDLIIVNGVNLYPQDIEQTAIAYPDADIHRACAFGWTQGEMQKVVVLVEVHKRHMPSMEAFIQYLLAHHDLPLFDVVFCPSGTLLMTTSGKIRRQACRELYRDNQITVLAEMDKSMVLLGGLGQDETARSKTFSELGIDSLSIAALVLELKRRQGDERVQKITHTTLYQMTLGEYIALYQAKGYVAARKIWRHFDKRMQQIERDRIGAILRDAKLSISPQEPIARAPDKAEISQVLLTGATGLIGAYLLFNLLKRTPYTVHVLVRASSVEEAALRVYAHLKAFELVDDTLDVALRERVIYYTGDLAQPQMGLPQETWHKLSSTLDAIFHNAATTHYLASYEALKPSNVDATRTILELAMTTRYKYVHHVSTTFIFGWTMVDTLLENASNDTFMNVDFGYSQSKWVAEQLVWQAGRLGVPIQIYRPSWVTASCTYHYTQKDIIARTLAYMVHHGVVLDIPNQMSLMPVDKLAHDLVSIALQPHPKHIAYHLTESYANIPMFARFLEKKYGYSFKLLDAKAFNDHLEAHAKPKDLIYPLVPFYSAHYQKISRMAHKIYSRDNYLETIASCSDASRLDYTFEACIEFNMQFLMKEGIIERRLPLAQEATVELGAKWTCLSAKALRSSLRYQERVAKLDTIAYLLKTYQRQLCEVVSEDFGHRSRAETMLEIFAVLQEITFAKKHLKRWMRPKVSWASVLYSYARLECIPSPLGVVGIMGAWNAPIALTLMPLVGAISAGNRVMIFASRRAPKTASYLSALIRSIFGEDEVVFVSGDERVAKAFSALKFDHLLYTGSKTIAHQIMHHAADLLTPLTLELGGKSPVLVGRGALTALAVEKIMMMKLFNAGQVCLSPDYVMLEEADQDAFIAWAQKKVEQYYPDIINNQDYSSLISAQHYERAMRLVDDARAKGARVVCLGNGSSLQYPNKMLPYLVLNPTKEMRIWHEEIFAPILMIVPYQQFDDAIALQKTFPPPLGLYYFGEDRNEMKRVLEELPCGGITVNDVGLHFCQPALPFGGVGASGMGQYHGEAGFKTFSKLKPVFYQRKWSWNRLFYPPFGRLFKTMMQWLLR